MLVRLLILRGKLQDRHGRKTREELQIRKSPFIIGAASDCSMYCRSNRINPRHCKLQIEPEKVVVQDLSSQTGTFVNGQRIGGPRILQNGDYLRIGRLEFQVLIEDPSPVWELGPRVDGDTLHDAMAETVCNLLSAADEQDRLRRLENPELRQFSLRSDGVPPHQPKGSQPKSGHRKEFTPKATRSRPGKLPPEVRSGGDSSVAAAKALTSCLRGRSVN